jgi:RHS repeat-associated protein
MEPASSVLSTGVPALAAIPQLAGNSRQGFGLRGRTMRWASGRVISSTSLGMKGSLYDGDAGSRSTGKERDQESNNDYFSARYYGSSMGRFLSPDWSAKVEPVPYAKLDDPQSLNLYAYVGNNPLTSIDPDGHCSGDGSCAALDGQGAFAAIAVTEALFGQGRNLLRPTPLIIISQRMYRVLQEAGLKGFSVEVAHLV